MEIYTVGHSTHEKEHFLEMLKEHGIEIVVDIRSIPFSRRYPHFNKYELTDAEIDGKTKAIHHPERPVISKWLAKDDIGYIHMPRLGGRRKKTNGATDVNDAWKNKGFKNYADYTTMDEFDLGLNELIELAKKHKVAYMCAEYHPSKCHRTIVSDNLTIKGIKVIHIISSGSKTKLAEHKLGGWGAKPTVVDGKATYPVESVQLSLF